jgi:hypothetical protein
MIFPTPEVSEPEVYEEERLIAGVARKGNRTANKLLTLPGTGTVEKFRSFIPF